MGIRKMFGIAQRLRERIKKREVVAADQYEQIVSDSKHAQMILESEEFKFFREYLVNRQKSILDAFARNKIRSVHEKVRLNPDLVKVFFTSKKEQEKEMSGEYKFIDEMMNDLKTFAGMEEELKKAEEKKIVTIEKNVEQ